MPQLDAKALTAFNNQVSSQNALTEIDVCKLLA